MDRSERQRIAIVGAGLGVLTLGAGFLLGRASVPPPPSPPDCEPVVARTPPPRDTRRPRADAPVLPEVGTAQAASADPGRSIAMAEVDLPIRESTEPDAPVIGTVPRGVTVNVLEIRGDFRRVALLDGSLWGWVVWHAEPRAKPSGRIGQASVAGVVRFTGTPPVMKVPPKRADAPVCQDKPVPDDTVRISDGRLLDVLVRLADDSVKDAYAPPAAHAEIRQVDCMYTPRVVGVVEGQTIDIVNADRTLHNVHAYQGSESLFNAPQIKDSPPLSKEAPTTPTILRLTCDVHPWMRAFVVVSHHPFFSVTDPTGGYSIANIPGGAYTVEAWHPVYGRKTARVVLEEGRQATVSFTYDGSEPEPPENRGGRRDLP